jgi:hypothetical protein
MEDAILNVVLGIVTGILTSAFLFFLKDYWNTRIRPFLEKLRYEGVSVEGAWRGHARDEHSVSEVALFLTQNAQKLSGILNFSFRGPLKQFVLEFEVTGYLWEGYLTLNFRPKDRAITTSATALFKIAGGGQGLAGQFCFRNAEIEAVTPVYLTLGKQIGPNLPEAFAQPAANPAPAPNPPAPGQNPPPPPAPQAGG